MEYQSPLENVDEDGYTQLDFSSHNLTRRSVVSEKGIFFLSDFNIVNLINWNWKWKREARRDLLGFYYYILIFRKHWRFFECARSLFSQQPFSDQSLVQLTLEQQGFELHRSTYIWRFFNHKYYSATPSEVDWICGSWTVDMENVKYWGSTISYTGIFLTVGG